jgi:hypothetical protein
MQPNLHPIRRARQTKRVPHHRLRIQILDLIESLQHPNSYIGRFGERELFYRAKRQRIPSRRLTYTEGWTTHDQDKSSGPH